MQNGKFQNATLSNQFLVRHYFSLKVGHTSRPTSKHQPLMKCSCSSCRMRGACRTVSRRVRADPQQLWSSSAPHSSIWCTGLPSTAARLNTSVKLWYCTWKHTHGRRICLKPLTHTRGRDTFISVWLTVHFHFTLKPNTYQNRIYTGILYMSHERVKCMQRTVITHPHH